MQPMADIVVHLIRGTKVGLILHKNEPPHVIPLPEFITDDTLSSIKRFLTAAFKRDDFPKPIHVGALVFKDHPVGTLTSSLNASWKLWNDKQLELLKHSPSKRG